MIMYYFLKFTNYLIYFQINLNNDPPISVSRYNSFQNKIGPIRSVLRIAHIQPGDYPVSRFRYHSRRSFFSHSLFRVMETFGSNDSVLSLPIRIELPFWLSLVLLSQPLSLSFSFISLLSTVRSIYMSLLVGNALLGSRKIFRHT